MSVAEDGNEQEQPGTTPQRADRAARHRVPPAASTSAQVPLLPEPFNPAKPTFPTGAAIPRQRRGGPTAIATASIPTIPVEDDRPDFDVLFADALGDDPAEPDEPPADEVEDPPADEADDATADDPSTDEAQDPSAVEAEDPSAVEVDDPFADEVEDPATVGTLAGEVRASAVPFLDEPVALSKPMVQSPSLVDPAAFESPAFESSAFESSAAASPAAASPEAEEPVDEVAAEPAPVGVAQVVVTADDSPTVADYVPPAFAIVTDDPGDEDGPDYRGSRRRIAAWRRYPVGAVAVAVLILLVTAAVVLQLVRDTGNDPVPAAGEASPQRYGGVGGLPELTKDAGAASPTGGPTSAVPSPSRTKSASPRPSVSASPSKSTSTAAPPPLVSGQLRGAGSAKCLEYRSGESNRAVIDNCDDRASGRTNQRWSFQSDGTIRADGGCLDVLNAGTANRTPVRLFTCNGTPAQKWTVVGDGTLRNVNAKRCLDVENGSNSAGSPVIIFDCSAASNQKWSLQAY
ncbi:ricin-type beta-trefoil lectin domain protein [Dactylosporangium sp. NPDC049525]|uniref:RICIN domain-containing protein n=1 Tax=Dactylosporangium sp. NPDC049525 TaxID=3154730 RepID=UPI00341917B2